MDGRILEIETAAMQAWPPMEIRELDGWRMRWHTAPSRRVNSVWPNAWGGGIPLALKLEQVEAYYAEKGQPARYQVCPAALPAGLDSVLEARGYTIDAPTGVRVADTRSVISAAESSRHDGPSKVNLYETLERDWAEAYCLVQGDPVLEADVRMAALRLVKPQTVYVSINAGSQAAAVGRGVVGVGWLGIFGMATHKDFRRRGLATNVIFHLSEWALQQGITQLYLQVMDVNMGALQLYGGLGFETLYKYHYRTR